MLHVEIESGDQIRVGDAVITLAQKSGRRARLEIKTPPGSQVNVVRGEKVQTFGSGTDNAVEVKRKL